MKVVQRGVNNEFAALCSTKANGIRRNNEIAK